MPEEVSTPVAVTADQIQTMINTALAGHATKYEKQLNKMHESFAEQVKGIGSKPAEVATEGTPTADPKLAALERTIQDLNQKYTASEEKALKSEQKQVLSDALGTFSFASQKAREVAFKTFESQMSRSQDGEFFIGDRDIKTAIQEQMKELPGLLKPLAVSGSGSVGTQNTPGAGALTMDEIRAAKTPEALRAIAEQLKAFHK
jgi:restriction endonuclease Mrr